MKTVPFTESLFTGRAVHCSDGTYHKRQVNDTYINISCVELLTACIPPQFFQRRLAPAYAGLRISRWTITVSIEPAGKVPIRHESEWDVQRRNYRSPQYRTEMKKTTHCKGSTVRKTHLRYLLCSCTRKCTIKRHLGWNKSQTHQDKWFRRWQRVAHHKRTKIRGWNLKNNDTVLFNPEQTGTN